MSASSLLYLFARVRVVFLFLLFCVFLQKTQNNKHCPDAEHFVLQNVQHQIPSILRSIFLHFCNATRSSANHHILLCFLQSKKQDKMLSTATTDKNK